jgi:hypothetical protein
MSANELSTNPIPVDGAIHADTWANLRWSQASAAVSHDVYFSNNFGDVNDGAAEAFRDNQIPTYFIVGLPGSPYPDGLVRGTTYYWRIDEVNDSEPNSPWKGPVWSLMIEPEIAYNPIPADGAELVNLDVELSWKAGFGAAVHYVHFGDNFDDVNNAALGTGTPSEATTYASGVLEPAKTYFWRVDESGVGRGAETHKGDIWRFATQGAVGNPEPAGSVIDVN